MWQEEMTYSAFESRYGDKHYIGSGGFSKVYKVFDHAKNHYVALKVADVKPEHKQFTLQREVELVNKLPYHRNIARYDACYRYNTGIAGEMDFAILKFYEYGNLEQFLNKQTLTLEDKRIIIQGILEGVSFLHRHNIIHRDLKAQNILLHREDGVWTPKITDFGLSRQINGETTMANSAIGLTYAYAAPEQIQNKKINKNVDLWSAGIIIYRIIEGKLPFSSDKGGDSKSTQSQLELSRKIINLELPDRLSELAEPYQEIIKRCLVSDSSERAQTAGELIVLLNKEPSPLETEEPKDDSINNTILIDQSSSENGKADDIKTEVLSEDKTEVIANKAKIETYKEPEVELLPVFESPTEYKEPKQNVTQILNTKTTDSKNQQEAIPPAFEPNMGGDQNGFNWFLLLIPICMLGLGTWFLADSPEPEIVQKPKTNNVTVAIAKPVNRDFKDLNTENNLAATNPEQLLVVANKITKAITANKQDYRPRYILAKNKIYSGKLDEAFNLMEEAKQLANQNGTTKTFIEKVEKDTKSNATIKQLFSKNDKWKTILIDK